MTLLLHLIPFPTPPPIPSQGADWAQMRDTLKNKMLIWDWVDSDGWPVLKAGEKRVGWVSLLFQWIQGADVLPHMAFSQSKALTNGGEAKICVSSQFQIWSRACLFNKEVQKTVYIIL